MKRFISSLFQKKKSDSVQKTGQNKYMPDETPPIEETFTLNFVQNGGKFLYNETLQTAQQAFGDIVSEKNWLNSEVLCFEDLLFSKFSNNFLTLTRTNLNAKFFLTRCEFLVAHDGSIIVCAKQLGTHKLSDLPDVFVVFAGTSQFTETLSDGLKGIKNKYKKNIPINITSVKRFKKEEHIQTENFLTYGSPIKEVYLILLEDF